MTPWRQSSSEKSTPTETNKVTDPQATPKSAALLLVKSAKKHNMPRYFQLPVYYSHSCQNTSFLQHCHSQNIHFRLQRQTGQIQSSNNLTWVHWSQ